MARRLERKGAYEKYTFNIWISGEHAMNLGFRTLGLNQGQSSVT